MCLIFLYHVYSITDPVASSCQIILIPVTSHERHCVSNRQPTNSIACKTACLGGNTKTNYLSHFMRGIHRCPVHKWPVIGNEFPCHDVVMIMTLCQIKRAVYHCVHLWILYHITTCHRCGMACNKHICVWSNCITGTKLTKQKHVCVQTDIKNSKS